MNKNRTCVLWLTGLSASGKTTIAQKVKELLSDSSLKIHHLDGDEVRTAAKEKLGFSKEDRDKNIKLAISLAKNYQEKGYVVIASFISPYRYHREWGRESLINYVEIFVNTPLEVCEQRDPKGLYKKVRAGDIKQFTGIDDPYEEPQNSDLEIRTDNLNVDQCANLIITYLKDSGMLC
ncbi:adenylyl-sulfate kinase [Candidatus Falkowbacteria bacterium CG10_big_fil_rev_8_21_14_0_10_44_15]|uniref:Adenylyl-sulfate kinase n=1 Tax=Candidatus Falkowbacteria bacterium CG10_big_fil_rev_8_21_14_0_10_44_15 TaxID=1974569 RepID=A0A2H0V1B6_9BACT|nr:MAG: adenylyl-sulfate kinase [Candidatus Falkowbacteria bacterium CG10_big_fil_rev_8_21_14_0_10_44_15]